MAVIDPTGLLNGKRLRQCSAMARLYWPYFYLMSNGFARVELDFTSLSFAFASFGAAAPTSTEIRGLFEEYEKNHLIFPYDADAQRWAQWDTRRSHVKFFKTATDRKSPNPPEPEYSRWLVEQHGDDWRAFHWNKDPGQDGAPAPEVVAQFPLDLTNSFGRADRDLVDSSSRVDEDLSLGVGVGAGVGVGGGAGVGDGDGVGSELAPPNDGGAPSSAAIAFEAKKPRSRTKRKTRRSTKRKSEPTTAAWRLAQLLREEILINKPNSRITQADLTKWAITADVMLRRDKRSEECIAAMIRWAQADPFWKAIIRSVGKLRQHFDVLELRAGQKGVRGNGRSLFDQAEQSVAGAAELFDSKAEDLEQALGGDIRGGRKAGA